MQANYAHVCAILLVGRQRSLVPGRCRSYSAILIIKLHRPMMAIPRAPHA